jgi:crotonobetainyl-CoA:carnitine CoA-transferase CaiB-like acyl-CoA transferase
MKLSGLKVIDLSSFLPGPYLTMSLADHGAEVLKVEQPGEGDPTRHIGLSDGPCTVFFRNLNRGKKSIALNLKDPAQRDLLLELVDVADVFVETFRPGAADRLGLGHEALRARNPRLVYCSISAFGNSGPYRLRPAHDLALEAVSGVLSQAVSSDGQPVIPAVAVADQLSALQGLSAVLMALLRRETTGRGDYIDIAMHDTMLAACCNIAGPTFAENRQPVARHERSGGGAAFYQVYRTRDQRHVVLAGQEAKFIENVLNALKRPDLIPICLRGPGVHQQPVIDFLAGVFGGMSQAEALDWLGTMDVCFGPVKTMPEAFEDEQALSRGMVLKDELGRRHIAPAIRFAEEPPAPSLREPKLGEHREAILQSWLHGKGEAGEAKTRQGGRS